MNDLFIKFIKKKKKKKKKIEEKINKNSWLKSLIDNQLINENLLFGVDFEENNSPKKSKKINKRKIPYKCNNKKKKAIIGKYFWKKIREIIKYLNWNSSRSNRQDRGDKKDFW